MIARLEMRIAQALRRTALGAAGVALVLVGVVFLTIAAWVALVAVIGVTKTALVIGAVFLGTGCIMLAVSARRTPPPSAKTADPMPDLMTAFVTGLSHGSNARDRYDHIRR